MIPHVKAFDKNVDGEAARDIEFTGAFSINNSGGHSNRFQAEFRRSIRFLSAPTSARPAFFHLLALSNKFCVPLPQLV